LAGEIRGKIIYYDEWEEVSGKDFNPNRIL